MGQQYLTEGLEFCHRINLFPHVFLIQLHRNYRCDRNIIVISIFQIPFLILVFAVSNFLSQPHIEMRMNSFEISSRKKTMAFLWGMIILEALLTTRVCR
jgi:hypothetical protein